MKVIKKLKNKIFGKSVTYKQPVFKYKLTDIEDVKDFIYKWNINYPIDRWWRTKHNVAFNSPEHRVISFHDMLIEWEEDNLYSEVFENKNFDYKLNSGNFMKPVKVKKWEEKSEQEIEDEYQNFKNEMKKIDLSQFDNIE